MVQILWRAIRFVIFAIMKIKYSLNQAGINFFFLAFLLCLTVGVNGQISGGEIKSKKEKGEKTKKEKPTFEADSLSGSIFYLSGLVQHSFRTFKDESVYDVHQQLIDEVPMTTGGVSLGVLVPLSSAFSLDAGVTYFGHGEAYNYEDPSTDSTFNYTNVYMQIGIPLKLRYTYGNDLQFFGYAGFAPINILNVRNKTTYTDSLGASKDPGLVLIKDGFTTFNLMAMGGVGVNYYLNHIGFSISAEYRRHLLNSYSEDTFKRVHKMYGIGVNVGINVRL